MGWGGGPPSNDEAMTKGRGWVGGSRTPRKVNDVIVVRPLICVPVQNVSIHNVPVLSHSQRYCNEFEIQIDVLDLSAAPLPPTVLAFSMMSKTM